MPSMASSNSSNTREIDELNGQKSEFIPRSQEIEQHEEDLPTAAVERRLLEEVSSNDTLMESDNADAIQKSRCSSSAAPWRAEEAIAGNSEALQALRELISYPMLYSCEAKIMGLKWPRGLLLYGPPGTGKTSLVRAVVSECGVHLTDISPHSVHKSHAGESEESLRKAFAEAAKHAPSVIFIDEIDALCSRRDSRSQQNTRITAQLGLLMDSINYSLPSKSHVVVVASTNRVDEIDPALRRSGRFDVEVEVSPPNEGQRLQILKLYTKKLSLDPSVDLEGIAASCNGYVGADLEALCCEAVTSALKRSLDMNITMDDWKHAKSEVGPSMTRGVTVEIPKVSWDDIGGLKDVKKKLQQAVEWPLKHSLTFSRLRISPVRGILLHGPPGCSKTTLAKAAAHAAQASFFSLSGAELFSMYVGEGEALLRNTFRRARLAAPSIIFFDEADVIAAERGGSSKGSTTAGERLLSTLLTEMDGLEEAKGILVLAATNRPYAIDRALMRPGRFDFLLYVPPPDLEARHDILRVHTRNMNIDNDVDLRQIAEHTELFTGADLEGLCNEAGIVALREDISATVVSNRHFQTVMRSLKPALTREDIDSYASFHKNQLRRPSSPSEASFEPRQPKRNRAKNLLLSAAPVGIVMVSVALYAGLKIISGIADVSIRELART